ncbi:MAG: hypothetical protein A2Z97_11285 [Bdellovibrionales bacterium GWB1_52_6]|nr:MAG: hypothetical protein A2Z97_11285 [Bdellovibrionales bacterium GWB1_52_6]OFZ06436.1 MAG: hypothetical protein A2X97_03180 [Bdellovibrionales bacterium GWA1_52_35]HCM40196.1 hypothetical protein [Bdellovibrionales bacterium]
MLTNFELHKMQESPNPDDVPRLVSEVENWQQYVIKYNNGINQQLDKIEQDMVRMEAENARILSAKEVLSVERDACAGLIARLAHSTGFRVGVAPENRIVVELPSGQVSWRLEESEAHLLEGLPAWDTAIEDLPIEETYRRVMNPGL